jgi:glycine cleavage system H protein
VESTKSVSDLFAPLDGTVVDVNTALEDAPEMVNAEPYGEGWMVDVECPTPEDADAAWSSLLTASQYADGLS